MSSPFQTEQATLAQLFSGDRVFAFPAFQRPYRWTLDEALTLLDDVAAACQRGDPGYFLGNLVLTPADGRTSLVIDGRQRLTTLFMLICVLRDLETDPARKAGLHRLIWDEANAITRSQSGWRLKFAETEQSAIEQNLANMNRTPAAGVAASIPERYFALFEVSEGLREALSKPIIDSGLPRLDTLTDYLLHQCEVIVLTAASSTSGLRLFQVLNNRGLQLSEADLIKPDLLQALPLEQQAKAAAIWDGLEDRLGPDNLDMLLRSYIFIITGEWVPAPTDYAPSLKAAMLSRGSEAFHFVDLPEYGEAFADLHWGDIAHDDPDENPNLLVKGLSFLGRSKTEWTEFFPVAMEILVQFAGNTPEIYRHIRGLDRLFFVWFINELPEIRRRQACSDIMDQLCGGEDLFAEGMGFHIPDVELNIAIAALKKPFPKLSARNALVRRIELSFCTKAGKAAPNYLELSTSAYILPRQPNPGTQWQIDYTVQERRQCLDLIGNGVPLTREIDKRVSNRDFLAKKTLYQEAGLDRYFLSVGDVCAHKKWLADDIRQRTDKLATMLADEWTTIPVEPAEDPLAYLDDDDEEETGNA